MVALSYPTVTYRNQETTRSSAQSATYDKPKNLDAFNELVLEHQDAVYQQAYWILGDEQAAEDATQEAFLRAYRNLANYNGGPFRPWVMKIATNYCYDQLRRQKVRKALPLEAFDEYDQEMDTPSWLKDPNANVEEIFERFEEQGRITKIMQRLAPEYRTAIILVDVQEMDYQEAATIMGVPLGTFKSRLARARLQMQKYLKMENIRL